MRFYRFSDCPWTDQHGAIESNWYMVKETPKGYWIAEQWDSQATYKKFVLKDGRKRFAYPTREQAFDAYLKRKEKQVTILTHQLDKARMRLVHNKTVGIPEIIPTSEPEFFPF